MSKTNAQLTNSETVDVNAAYQIDTVKLVGWFTSNRGSMHGRKEPFCRFNFLELLWRIGPSFSRYS